MIILEDIIEGIFVAERSNRFLCTVSIKDKMYECYIPCASKLKNYLNMKNKKVLIIKNKSKKAKTEYSLFAVLYYNKYIIINQFIANRVIEEHLKKEHLCGNIYREKYIEDYKSDLLIVDREILAVEIKGVIAARKKIVFPTVYSYRAIEQLNKILVLLAKGYMVQYFIISLSPFIETVTINKDIFFSDYYNALLMCIEKGMRINGYNISFSDNNVSLGKKLKIFI